VIFGDGADDEIEHVEARKIAPGLKHQ
jgi:hypothetical protein